MAAANLPIFLLCWVCLIGYGLVGPHLFRPMEPAKRIWSKDLLFYLFVGMLARVMWCAIFYKSAPLLQIAGCVMGGCGLALFLWAYRQHGNQMPGRAYTPDAPAVLITSGPYCRVRHPIYMAYLLSFLGMSVGTGDGVLGLAWVLMVWLYFQAARLEEELLGNSIHASAYRLYQEQSGMLLPWNFWRPKKV